MSTAGRLEARYRRLLRWYPAWYRARHGEELLGVLMTAARPGQRRPGVREVADLLWSGLKIRVRSVLRGAGREPWTEAFALFAVLMPLLMLLLRVLELGLFGRKYGFGSPADILIGAYGEPGAWAQSFQLNPFMIALTGNLTQALTAGPLPPLVLAVLVLLGLRRTAAAVAASVPLIFLALAFTSSYTLVGGPRSDVTLYFYAIEALALLATADASIGWKALRWRPGTLLAVATVAFGLAVNGGLRGLFLSRSTCGASRPGACGGSFPVPHGFLARTLGAGRGGWGYWLFAEGTLTAIIIAVLAIMLISSPVYRRVLILLAVPFVLGAVMYACSRVNPPLPAALGNTVASAPLFLMLLAALALSTGRPESQDKTNEIGTA